MSRKPYYPPEGTRFGKWVVRGPAPTRRHVGNHARVFVECDCGTARSLPVTVLTKGRSVACGCAGRQKSKLSNTKHGGSDSNLYKIWRSMRDRCENPKSKDYCRYGARGIQVCRRWQDFSAFRADVGDRPSKTHGLDRIDNDGHYEPNNVRWATAYEQSLNKRTNRRVECFGRNLTLTEWAKVIGISVQALCYRLEAGWPVEKAMSSPRTDSRAYEAASGQ